MNILGLTYILNILGLTYIPSNPYLYTTMSNLTTRSMFNGNESPLGLTLLNVSRLCIVIFNIPKVTLVYHWLPVFFFFCTITSVCSFNLFISL